MGMIKDEKPKKGSPLGPLLGFILLIVVGGGAYLIAPLVVEWLASTRFTLGALGPILPFTFPSAWPPIIPRLIVAGVIFLLLFTLFMILAMLLMKPTSSETDVSIAQVRKEKQAARHKYR